MVWIMGLGGMTMHAEQAAEEHVETTHENIKLSVSYAKVYASSRSVELHYEIENRSGAPIYRFQADDTIDLELWLIDPDGFRLEGYEGILGRRAQGAIYKRLFVETIAPSEKSKDSINLAPYFKLRAPGMYKCVLIKKVYQHDASVVKNSILSPPGRLLVLVSPEFRFEVAAMDPTYKSPLDEGNGEPPKTTVAAEANPAVLPKASVAASPAVSIPVDPPDLFGDNQGASVKLVQTFIKEVEEGDMWAAYLVPRLYGEVGVTGFFGEDAHAATANVGYFMGEDAELLAKGLCTPLKICAYDQGADLQLVPLFSNKPTDVTAVVHCLFINNCFSLRFISPGGGSFAVLYGPEFSQWVRSRMVKPETANP